ncbi:MAG: TetR family transcriptional regulator [Mycobacterium sp.]
MALQARAEATRRRILDSAVDLFTELGYGETGLADVLTRAGVSKGAFYYHFDSKEAVAVAIIEDYRRRNMEAVLERIDPAAPVLDRMIVASFTSAALIETDRTARIGNELLQALGQVSSVATRIYGEWTADFITNLSKAFDKVGARTGVDTTEMAEATWTAVLGCHLLSGALDDNPHPRLARAWRAMLRSVLPEDSLEHYDDLLDRSAKQLQTV